MKIQVQKYRDFRSEKRAVLRFNKNVTISPADSIFNGSIIVL